MEKMKREVRMFLDCVLAHGSSSLYICRRGIGTGRHEHPTRQKETAYGSLRARLGHSRWFAYVTKKSLVCLLLSAGSREHEDSHAKHVSCLNTFLFDHLRGC